VYKVLSIFYVNRGFSLKKKDEESLNC